jgi:hypothetical protein
MRDVRITVVEVQQKSPSCALGSIRRMASRGQLRGPRKYGDIDESDEVHDEIREVGMKIRRQLQARAPSDVDTLTAQLQAFGPSEESKAMMLREDNAARAAIATGVYGSYRNTAKRAQQDCFRVGPQSICFCGHALSAHQMSRGGPPRCGDCSCQSFSYVPAAPAEIGEEFLTRRKGFDPSAWFPKCHCGHGPRSHDPRTRRCNACRSCFRFEGHFACLVCDGRYEDHETLFESAAERRVANLPVGDEYVPLAREDRALQELVFGASRTPSSGAARPAGIEMARPRPAVTDGRVVSSGAGSTRIVGNPFGEVRAAQSSCSGCGAAYRLPTSKFCSECGRKREL